MPNSAEVKITQDFKLLEQLNKNFKTKLVAKIGILGNKTNRNNQNTNALIGAIHEFGSVTKNIPRRSFLKDPITLKAKEIEKVVADSLSKDFVKKGGDAIAFERAAIKGEEIVQRAFQAGGFGKWEPLSKKTIDRKGSSSKLIDTAQLRKSISSKVDKQ